MKAISFMAGGVLTCVLLVHITIAAAEDSGDQQAVQRANEAYYAAVSARSTSSITSIWSHNVSVTNIFGVSPAPAVGWESVREAYNNLFRRFPKLSVKMPVPMIRIREGVAIVVGLETQQAEMPDGSLVDAKLPATNVFVVEGNQWLMIHHHTSRPPS